MFYSISEASKILKTTRATVYKKVERLDSIQEHIVTKNNGKFIDDIGLEMIRQSLIDNQKSKSYTKVDTPECIPQTSEKDDNLDSKPLEVYTEASIQLVDSLQRHIQELTKQLDIKDKQIEIKDNQISAKDRQIDALTDISKNNQVLLREAQQKIFLLESPKEQGKRSFWDRFFS